RFQLSIEAAQSVPLKTVTKLIPESAIQRSQNGGKTQFNCEIGPLEPRKSLEGNLPSDVPGYPYVSFSTGRTWEEIATKYEAVVDQDLPGLGVFNHAIVYVTGDHPLWIDATSAESRVGDLPTADQGRLALIATRGTVALERTPESSAEDNKRTHTIEIHLSDFGAGEIRETVEAQGYMETRLRQAYDGSDVKKLKDALEKYV